MITFPKKQLKIPVKTDIGLWSVTFPELIQTLLVT